MPKERVRTSITLDPSLAQWLDKQVEDRRFKDRTHGIEYCLDYVRKHDLKTS